MPGGNRSRAPTLRPWRAAYPAIRAARSSRSRPAPREGRRAAPRRRSREGLEAAVRQAPAQHAREPSQLGRAGRTPVGDLPADEGEGAARASAPQAVTKSAHVSTISRSTVWNCEAHALAPVRHPGAGGRLVPRAGVRPARRGAFGSGPRHRRCSRRRRDARVACTDQRPTAWIHVEFFARGKVMVVPAGIGVAPPLRRDGAYVRGGRCRFPLSTTEPTGSSASPAPG